MDLQELEKMINNYLNDIVSFGEEDEYENAKEVLIDFLLYYQTMEDDIDDDFKTWNEAPYGDDDDEALDDVSDDVSLNLEISESFTDENEESDGDGEKEEGES